MGKQEVRLGNYNFQSASALCYIDPYRCSSDKAFSYLDYTPSFNLIGGKKTQCNNYYNLIGLAGNLAECQECQLKSLDALSLV